MENYRNKDYTIDNEQLARFAKAMGHPARITILHYLASLDSCYFGDIHNELPIAKATVSHTRRNRNPESKILYQPRKLG